MWPISGMINNIKGICGLSSGIIYKIKEICGLSSGII